MNGVLDHLSDIAGPPKQRRPRDRRRRRDRGKTCPYCLFDLTHFDPKEFEEIGNVCLLCRHRNIEHLLMTPLHLFDRSQQWDFLANEMEYIWRGEHRDVDSYLTSMGPYYNPDYTYAKEVLYGMLAEKDAVFRLREEFLEAEGELDLLIIGFLKKLFIWRGDMAKRLLAGRPWRSLALRLSVTAPSDREKLQFQISLMKATPWGNFRSPEEKEELVVGLEKVLQKMSQDQWDQGA